jgi:hypothetical protein
MTRPCFALTVLAALLGISLCLASQAQCQTLTDLYRCGSDYSEICPFVDGAPNVQDEVPPNTEELDLRGMSVVAFLEDPSHDEMTDVTAEETYDYDNCYEDAYRKYYAEAYGCYGEEYGVNEKNEAQTVVADPEPETMTEAMQVYSSGHDAVYDDTVDGLQPKQDSEDGETCLEEITAPMCHESPSRCEQDEYCADEYDDEYYDEEYYDQYYGGDYRYYDDGEESNPVATQETTDAREYEEACYGYENYGPKYDYARHVDSTPSVPEADAMANKEVVEPENWDSEGYDYDEYYDYRDDYEEQYSQEPAEVEPEQPANDNWDEDRHGYYDYAYPYGYDGDDETYDDSYDATEVAADDAEACEWDRDADGFYDEMSKQTPYDYDEYGAEAAERYEEECSEEQPAEVDASMEDEAWDDGDYGYDHSLGEECTSDLESIYSPEAEPQDPATDVECYEDECNEYDEVYDDVYNDYYHDDCGCPEIHAAAKVRDVAQLGRDVLESAMQSELATVMRGQADKLFVKAGSLISDANMDELWQRLHQAAESEANAVALHQPNVFVFYFEVDQVTKAELAGRGALVWAAQVLDRVGSACQRASEQLEQLATVEFRDTWMAQQDSATQR